MLRIACLSAVLLACSDDPRSVEDAGTRDAGGAAIDAGTSDAGLLDDAGAEDDAGVVESGDAGTRDAGGHADAGTDDAGRDVMDSGMRIDGGIDAGPAPIDAGPRPDAPCGLFGDACCPGDTCFEGACLEGSCATFGGAFVEEDRRSCDTDNPYTLDCTCPPGFDAIAETDIDADVDEGDVEDVLRLTLCYASAGGGGDFVGAWNSADGDSDEDTCSGCREAHPDVASCGCPAGTVGAFFSFTPRRLCDWSLELCVGADPVTFGGAYISRTSSGCITPNPVTGDCGCPAGTTARGFPDSLNPEITICM